MLYLDTSVLVAAMTEEPHTERIQTWMAAQDPRALIISEWVVTEFSAALSIKLRTLQIEPNVRSNVLADFKILTTDSIPILPVSRAHFYAAAKFADQYSLGLRAGDALHLAIAADHGATLCTLDRRQAEAGAALGVKSLLP
jgi:predicted nucleic acid-binding protein